MRPNPAEGAVLLAAAVARLPFALFWGPRSVARRAAHDFVWGSEPAPRPGSPPLHVWRISCEPPCYGCASCCSCGGVHG